MEIRLHSLQGMRSVIYNVVVFETSVLDRPHENDERAFFKNDLHAGVRFWKDAFSVTVFTQYVWTVDQTGEGKKPDQFRFLENLPTYPSPKPSFCPKWKVSVNVSVGER